MLNKENKHLQSLISYINKTLSIKVEIKIWNDERDLPLLLKEQYSFNIIHLSDSDCLLFNENKESRNTPSVISKHCKMLSQYWHEGIIYSKSTLSSIDRTRLIQDKIPFIIPGKQLYLPFLGMDLKEIFPPEKKRTEKLSPSAQLLILGKLYKKDWIRESPSKISGIIGLAKMSIGRAFAELENHNIVSIRTSGKEKKMEFNSHGLDLWNNTVPLLKSPVTSSNTVPYQENVGLVLAGFSALSRYSMINEASTTTYAVFNRTKDFIIQTEWSDLFVDREITVEKWSYDPRILSQEDIADPLSIYLEFKNSDDERIEEALNELLKDIQW